MCDRDWQKLVRADPAETMASILLPIINLEFRQRLFKYRTTSMHCVAVVYQVMYYNLGIMKKEDTDRE